MAIMHTYHLSNFKKNRQKLIRNCIMKIITCKKICYINAIVSIILSICMIPLEAVKATEIYIYNSTDTISNLQLIVLLCLLLFFLPQLGYIIQMKIYSLIFEHENINNKSRINNILNTCFQKLHISHSLSYNCQKWGN